MKKSQWRHNWMALWVYTILVMLPALTVAWLWPHGAWVWILALLFSAYAVGYGEVRTVYKIEDADRIDTLPTYVGKLRRVWKLHLTRSETVWTFRNLIVGDQGVKTMRGIRGVALQFLSALMSLIELATHLFNLLVCITGVIFSPICYLMQPFVTTLQLGGVRGERTLMGVEESHKIRGVKTP